MTREQAERRCAELNDAAVEGDPGRWMVQQADGGEWKPVHVSLPGLAASRGPLKETTAARPSPEAEDPQIPDWKIAPPG